MLLLLFNSVGGTPSTAVYSTGNGVVCLHAALSEDTLSASVIMGELVASLDEAMLTASVTDVTLSKTFTC